METVTNFFTSNVSQWLAEVQFNYLFKTDNLYVTKQKSQRNADIPNHNLQLKCQLIPFLFIMEQIDLLTALILLRALLGPAHCSPNMMYLLRRLSKAKCLSLLSLSILENISIF